ncbi:SGNH/GDSL hydrolase family protein [Curtobacterium sp. ISL-83]|uniref:SGNH/GDSL hydrolase family protein n=1 Tax=Curtobacterium sp. ISL-83 TaxID=2819145 RepID=UPI001BE82270|nr:SGNH/GDSL hydrolase family protein [Curtobacterium sp. ISL-83]MBT2503481.1 SGNH/GDSL hydrolase family protein [Curtobacterium sp. ISL-83]
MRTTARTLLASALAVCTALAVASCAGTDASAASAAGTGSAPRPTATARPWDHARGARVALIGDSITGGHGLTIQQAWPSLLADAQHWQLSNLSCNGAGVLTQGDADDCAGTYDDLADRTVALHPRVIIVQASSNDLGQDDDALPGAVEQLVVTLHRQLPHARIIGLSAIWNESAPPAQLARISSDLRSAVRQIGGTYVDIGEPLRDHPTWMQADDVHPTARGQRAIETSVAAAFARDDVTF